MMRSLYTAGSGMMAQQLNVDIISNNLANVNTTAYKKERAEFKDHLYQTMNRAYLLEDEGKPVNLQVGHGTYVTATVRDFETGNIVETGEPLDMAIEGDAFFSVIGPSGNVQYTKDGSFKASPSDAGVMVTTSDGYPLLDDMGSQIFIPDNVNLSTLTVSTTGELSHQTTGADGATVSEPLNIKIGLYRFSNMQGLEKTGSNLYAPTSASGVPVLDADTLTTKSLIRQGFIENSNVQVVEEMVKLIVAQRAYEVNSKAIQTSDEMLGMANNLRR